MRLLLPGRALSAALRARPRVRGPRGRARERARLRRRRLSRDRRGCRRPLAAARLALVRRGRAAAAGMARRRSPALVLARCRLAAVLWLRRASGRAALRRPAGEVLACRGAGRAVPPAAGVAGRAGAVTPDGALSGIVALRVRDGRRASRLRAARALQRQPEVAPRGAARARAGRRRARSPWPPSSSMRSSSPAVVRLAARSCPEPRARPCRRPRCTPPSPRRSSPATASATTATTSRSWRWARGRCSWPRAGSARPTAGATLALVRRAAAGPGLLVPHPGGDPAASRWGSCFCWRGRARALRSLPALAARMGRSATPPGCCGTPANGGETFRYLLPGGDVGRGRERRPWRRRASVGLS